MFRSISLIFIRERGLPCLQEGFLSPLSLGSYLVLLSDDRFQADFSSFDGHGELVFFGQAEFLPMFLRDEDTAFPVHRDGLHTTSAIPFLIDKDSGQKMVGQKKSHHSEAQPVTLRADHHRCRRLLDHFSSKAS